MNQRFRIVEVMDGLWHLYVDEVCAGVYKTRNAAKEDMEQIAQWMEAQAERKEKEGICGVCHASVFDCKCVPDRGGNYK
jgi:hypothetical protein